MNTNELLEHVHSTLSMLNRDLDFIANKLQDNRDLLVPLIESINGTMSALDSYIKVFVTELSEKEIEERALKNQAYFFIIGCKLTDQFNEFCLKVTKDKVKEMFPLIDAANEGTTE